MAHRDEERLRGLEAALDRLRRAAPGAVLVVEGPKDAAALDRLGVGGAVRTVNQGHALEVWMDRLCEEQESEAWREAILLLDWDRTGGRLMRRISDGLKARMPVDLEHRRRIAAASHAKCVEDVPADLAGLRRRLTGR